jgi:antagonist of KipI
MIEVIEPGAFTTVQDLGRPGFGRWGVPPSGAMDAIGLRAANLACGNEQDAAGLECTIAGPVLRFETDAVVAIGGSVFSSTLDGEPVPHLAAFRVHPSQTLSVGRTTGGARCTICVRGGLATEVLLGSRSAYPAGGIGRAVVVGDRLPFGQADLDTPLRSLEERSLPAWSPAARIRAVPGPQDAAFSPEARHAFFGESFSVGTRADRTGVRLDGPPLRHSDRAEIPPEGLVAGAVQVPRDGAPIVLGVDRPATGGYAKIATVITADLSTLGQARPGDVIRFAEVDVEEARAAWASLEARLVSALR